MPPLDNAPMDLARYLSVLDPFLVFVTLLIVVGIVQVAALCADLVIRAINREEP